MKKITTILAIFAVVFFQAKITAQPVNSTDYPLSTELNIAQFNPAVFVNPWDENQILNTNVKYDLYNQGSIWVWEITNGQTIYSANDGGSWTESAVNDKATTNSCPAPQINRDGRFFTGYTNTQQSQIVSWSDDQGVTWNDITIKQAPGNLKSLAQNHLWIDNSERSMYEGNVYAAWRYVGIETIYYSIEFSRSVNGGTEWENSRVLSVPETQGAVNEQWPVIQTGPFGEVYSCWSNHDFSGTSPETEIGFCRSFDGGNNFGANFVICDNILGTTGYFSPKGIDLNSAPAMAVDISGGPYDGRIYVAWANIGIPGINTGQDIDIYMIASDSHGGTWTQPVKVNQDPGSLGKEHLFPAITCDPETGTVTIIYYDDRNVASDMAEVYASISYDGGLTFTDFKISDVAFDFDDLITINGVFLSHKIGVSASHGKVYPVWADFREGFCRTVTSPFNENPFNRPKNFEAEIIDWDNGTALLTWDMDNMSGLLHFNIYRDNELIGTTSSLEFSENLPGYGNYTYRVTAQLTGGESSPETDFVSWGIAEFLANTDQFDIEIKPDDQATYLLKISNEGTIPLNWDISFRHDPDATPSKDGGPDDFGYLFMDNFDPGGPVFDYIDISETGTEITGIANDNYVGPFSTGFSFPFYDNYYDEFYISSNGLITFDGSFSNPINSPIPIADGNNNFIAWCWDDLQKKTGGQVFYQQFEDYTIIQFKDYAQNGVLSQRYTIDAEVFLYKNGSIKIQYLDHTPGLFVTNSCTIGIENENGNDGLQVAYNEFYLEDGLAVQFYNPGVNWINTVQKSGSIQPGEFDLLEVGFLSSGYSIGDYYANIIFNTNDPEQPQFTIPAHMNISNSAPNPPQNLETELVSGQVILTWGAPQQKGLLGYNVYDFGEKINISLVGPESYTVMSPTPGGHVYYVTAVYDEGESNPGNISTIYISGALQQEFVVNAGWSGISSYLIPNNPNIENIFAPIIDDVEILIGSNGIFWPGQNINTLGDWDYQQGYKIKMGQDEAFSFPGSEITLSSLSLPIGWNIVPVWSNCGQNVEDIFYYDENELVIVKEVAGTGVYWPELGINTLQTVNPGKSYEVKSIGEVYLSFAGCDGSGTQNGGKPELDTPWNDPAQTGSSHTVAILETANTNLLTGDVIGVFNTEGLCTGVAQIDVLPTALVVFGDDFSTEAVDGMVAGEAMAFKLYRPDEDKVYDLEVAFDGNMPEQGTFVVNGLSAIMSIDLITLGVDEEVQTVDFNISPNPTNGNIQLSFYGDVPFAEIIIANSQGQIILRDQINAEPCNPDGYNLTGLPAGVYFLSLRYRQSITTRKFIIQK